MQRSSNLLDGRHRVGRWGAGRSVGMAELRAALACGLAVGALLVAPQATQAGMIQRAAAALPTVQVSVCETGLRVTINDRDFYPPGLSFSLEDASGPVALESEQGNARSGYTHTYYAAFDQMPPGGAQGVLIVNGQSGTWYIPFTVEERCTPALGSLRGAAFEDRNANGRRDAGEPTMGGAWFKITDGGNWFVCGYTGDDSTYGVPLVVGTYYVFPIAPAGWRTTTPRLKAAVTGRRVATLGADMGFVRDASVKTVEGCDLYNPPR